MNRNEWIEKCAARYMAVAGLNLSEATDAARVCADLEENCRGTYDPTVIKESVPIEEWLPAEDAADFDMDEWSDDGD